MRSFDNPARRLSLAIGLAIVCVPGVAQTTGDLGSLGPTYEIAEPDAIEAIKKRLLRAQESGEIDALNKREVKQVESTLRHPPRVAGIRTTTTPATHYWDPTITVSDDIKGPNGQIIVPRGTTANPFDTIKVWSRVLLFIDADDAAEVAWAKLKIDRYGYRAKVILVNGGPFDLMKAWNRPVYFDQGGQYTRKLEIAQVPAIAYQEGRRIRIDEVLPTDERNP